MSLGITNAVAGATLPTQGGGSGPIETPSEKNAQAAVQSLKAYNQPDPSGASVKTERVDAVQATPTSAPATVVDFYSGQSVDDQVPEYPITGPDQFAKTMAVRNAEPIEEPVAAKVEVETKEAAAASNLAVESLETAPVAKEAETGGAGSVSRDNASSQAPSEASLGASEAFAQEQQRVAAEDRAQNNSSGGETSAEAAEVRLTE